MILNAVMSINRIFIDLSKSTASAARIREVLNIPEDQPIRELPQYNTDSHIEFRDVTFSYNEHTEEDASDCLSHISFDLRHGESLGIIGSTGCGKTTVINLLMRFYDANSGEILLNGRNVQSIPLAEVAEQFGVVFQNDILFADTVYNNIGFGRDLTPEAIRSAAEDAQALGFVEHLPKSFDSEIAAKGANLSGGQKQRLLIARALAAHPQILILDDSSSALDYKTDASSAKSAAGYTSMLRRTSSSHSESALSINAIISWFWKTAAVSVTATMTN